jgi:hypothetical protein
MLPAGKIRMTNNKDQILIMPSLDFFFFSRGQKDFICREFSWRKEKRKTAYWRMQGDPETGDPHFIRFLRKYRCIFAMKIKHMNLEIFSLCSKSQHLGLIKLPCKDFELLIFFS